VFWHFREEGFRCIGVFVERVRDFVYSTDTRMFFVLDTRLNSRIVPRFVCPNLANPGQYIHWAPEQG
jgi:hypothetical protein